MNMSEPMGSPGGSRSTNAAKGRKTLIFANDKSSGKTTTANAVLVSLLQRYPGADEEHRGARIRAPARD